MRETQVAVVGAGQAGLSAAWFLRKAGLANDDGFVVLDADPGPGGAWQHRWDTLTFGTAHGIHPLPGRAAPESGPDEPAARVVARYFGDYERDLALPVHRPVRVTAVREHGDGRLRIETDGETWVARGLINATGTWTRPFVPYYPGAETFRGRQLHTATYRGPAELAGLRVVVAGGGNSAVQHVAEISKVADTTWVTRREPVWHTGFGEGARRDAVALVEARVRAGLPPRSVVSVTGLGLTPEVLDARERGALHRLPMFERLEPGGVRWADETFRPADVVLWATGFRAALDHLAPLRLRGPGGGIPMSGTRVERDPRIHLAGYGPSASTIGANRAGRAAVRELRRWLATHGDEVPDGADVIRTA